MSRFKFPPSIRSRPVYETLKPRDGNLHLMIAEAEGAEALFDLADRAENLMAHAHIIYIKGRTGDTYLEQMTILRAHQLYISPSYSAALPRLRRVLSDAKMGLQAYLTGTEGMMGKAMLELTSTGIPHTAIQCEHRGSTARRMQCVHCKGMTEDVTTDPFVCSHCGLNLFVRDHYSRRLAAFQGVCVDAEDPGNVPDKMEIYQ